MRDLLDLGRRISAKVKNNYLSLIAAGVAFYGMLAVFPAIIAFVALYGLIADPAEIQRQLEPVTKILPPAAGDLLTSQLTDAAQVDRGGLTIGLVISLAATVWAAAGGVRALSTGLSIVYEEHERRGFVSRTATALGLTIGALVAVILALGLVAVFPIVLDHVGLNAVGNGVAEVVRWLVLLGLVGIGLAALYRWGPSRERPRWQWMTWGIATAAGLLIVGSVGFSIYVSNFSSYNETYGTLAAVVVLMLWLYLSAFAVLLGASVDAVIEAEHTQE